MFTLCFQYNIEFCEWPDYSSDFHAVELIKQKIKNKNSKSQRDLENAVDEARNDLSLHPIQECIKKSQTLYEDFVSSYLTFISIINVFTCTIHIYPRKFLLSVLCIF